VLVTVDVLVDVPFGVGTVGLDDEAGPCLVGSGGSCGGPPHPASTPTRTATDTGNSTALDRRYRPAAPRR
jgi:hypothetical protein